MDARLQGNSQFHYGVNGGAAGRNSRLGQDDTLHFLSQEEKECLQFFENTIVSLEESLEDDPRRSIRARTPESHSRPIKEMDGPPTSTHAHFPIPPSPKDQDIIDLVRPEPDLVQTKETISPDFKSMFPNPESHFEIKPRHDPQDSIPSEYNPPLPSGSYGHTDSHSYHPPGSIPTPVLIAQKIAENQGSGPSNIHPSALLHRLSLETENPQSSSTDPPAKHGPPTSAKPTRFPANISVILGNKEHQNQPLANVNIHERRAQMLANLSGSSHPLVQENSHLTVEQTTRNLPSRSISFKDPTPDKSRMEALSKLGLNRNRAMSGGTALFDTPDSGSLNVLRGADAGAKSPDASPSPSVENKLPEIVTPPLSQIHVDRKPEILRTDSHRSYEERSPQSSPSPTSVTQSSYYPPPLENKAPNMNLSQIHVDKKPEVLWSDPRWSHGERSPQMSPSPTSVAQRSYYPPPSENKATISPPPEVTSVELNSYGGKSIMVHPSITSRNEPSTSPTTPEPTIVPPVLSNPTEFNSYGGKSKVLNPALVAPTRKDLPDILSSHIDKSHPPPTKTEPRTIELNSYGGKSLTINPTVGMVKRPSDSPARSAKSPPPTPSPRPPRHSYHAGMTPQLAASQALSPDHKRRTNSLFRPQSITVEFSGRGPMDESRREALRKLGLLKHS